MTRLPPEGPTALPVNVSQLNAIALRGAVRGGSAAQKSEKGTRVGASVPCGIPPGLASQWADRASRLAAHASRVPPSPLHQPPPPRGLPQDLQRQHRNGWAGMCPRCDKSQSISTVRALCAPRRAAILLGHASAISVGRHRRTPCIRGAWRRRNYQNLTALLRSSTPPNETSAPWGFS